VPGGCDNRASREPILEDVGEPLIAGVTAFAVVFGIFVVATVALAIYVAVWAIRRDAKGRQEWERQQRSEDAAPD
jgi:uncharacterized membrane protein